MQRISHVLPTPLKTRHTTKENGYWLHTRHDAAILAKREEEPSILKGKWSERKERVSVYTRGLG
jgi:hypothetical protein